MYETLLEERCPSYSGILAGTAKGDCYFSKEEPPLLAVIYSWCVGGYGILADRSQIHADAEGIAKIKQFLYGEVFPAIKEKGFEEFEFSVEDEELRNAVLEALKGEKLEQEMEYSFRRGEKLEEQRTLPSEYQLVQVDEHFLAQVRAHQYKQEEMLLPRVNASFQSDEDFLKNSLAIAVLYEETIVGICFGSARFHEYLVVDIKTDKNHRRKGIATAMTTAFVNACVDKKCVVQWDCVDSNDASKAVAKACGFQPFKARKFYWFTF
ncbi:GNAT family N-acetyltransferase [Anaerosporobacter faecicola]|uniref:GNAT family N-acetyltransferase n=1 Tax=Anaerosporobacter faecicola TaxID=2718714 RepID=UPI0014397B9A|nr:GNAT family N-acetyltransferase [Anaerosporobacter faecicola]